MPRVRERKTKGKYRNQNNVGVKIREYRREKPLFRASRKGIEETQSGKR